MSAAEVLAQHQADPSTGYCICGGLEYEPSDPDEMTTLATHQADALRAAGYAVVELPQANSFDAWPVIFGGEIEDVYGKTNGDVVISGVETMSSNEARSLAVALLAAADVAEATP